MKEGTTLTPEQQVEKQEHEQAAARADFIAHHAERQAENAEGLVERAKLPLEARSKLLPPEVQEFVKERMAAGLTYEQSLAVYRDQRRHDAELQRAASGHVCRTATRAAARVGKECGSFWEPPVSDELKATLTEIVASVMEGKERLKESADRDRALHDKNDRLLARLRGGAIDPLAPDAEKRLITKQQLEGMQALVAFEIERSANQNAPLRRDMATRLQRFGAAIRPLLVEVYEHMIDTAPRVLAPFYLDPFTARRIIAGSDAARFVISLRDNPPWGMSGGLGNYEAGIAEADEVLRLCSELLAGRIPFQFDCSKQFEQRCKAEAQDGLCVGGEFVPIEGGKRHADVSPSQARVDVIAHSLPSEANAS